MHNDLVLISGLWQVDAALDQLKKERLSLEQAKKQAAAAVEGAQGLARTQAEAIQARTQSQRALERELESYQEQRARAQRAMEAGVGSYEAAERQLDACQKKISGLEDQLLEGMEAQDEAQRQRALTERALADATAALSAAAAALDARLPSLLDAMTTLLHARKAHDAAFPAYWKNTYLGLREKGKPALVNTDAGLCQSCRCVVPPQRISETKLGRGVFQCPGCDAFLLP